MPPARGPSCASGRGRGWRSPCKARPGARPRSRSPAAAERTPRWRSRGPERCRPAAWRSSQPAGRSTRRTEHAPPGAHPGVQMRAASPLLGDPCSGRRLAPSYLYDADGPPWVGTRPVDGSGAGFVLRTGPAGTAWIDAAEAVTRSSCAPDSGVAVHEVNVAAAYELPHGEAVLVRPDGHVRRLQRPPDGRSARPRAAARPPRQLAHGRFGTAFTTTHRNSAGSISRADRRQFRSFGPSAPGIGAEG